MAQQSEQSGEHGRCGWGAAGARFPTALSPAPREDLAFASESTATTGDLSRQGP